MEFLIDDLHDFQSLYPYLFHYSYFIFNDQDKVTLFSIEWFSPKICNRAHLKTLNVFQKSVNKWIKNFESHEKFKNFFGCELVMMLPAQTEENVIYKVSGYAYVEKDATNFEIFGITPKIFEIASKVYNYKSAYQPVLTDTRFIYDFRKDKPKIIFIKYKFKTPNVYFEVISVRRKTDQIFLTGYFTESKYYYLMTPGEKYTSYEKMTFPFDLLTWIMLLTTFTITFLTIFIVNHLSQKTKNIVYGNKIKNPMMNVLSIFFGISQTRLPQKNFPRFILYLFIWFCLIFRTCFQNKLFEFMTTDHRKNSPKYISDLIDENYTIYTYDEMFSYQKSMENRR